MTRVSQRQLALEQQTAQGADFRYGIDDGMSAAFDEAFSSGPTMAIVRGVQSVFDTSKEIDPHAANEQFGLLGTDAAFKDGDKVTTEMAKSVSDDYYRRRLNSIVKETVNAESPIMGNITQFAGSLAAGFADPVMLAANMGGAALIGRAGNALINSKRAFDTVSKVSPQAGRLLQLAYGEGTKRGLTAIVAREGLENFVGGALEEGVVRGFDVGEERLAVKTDWSDSMLNIVAGTVLGTGLSIPLSGEGRQVLMRKFGRMFGDDAPLRVQNELQMSDIESKLGIEKSHIETDLYENEIYGAREWHGDDQYRYNEYNPNEPGAALPPTVYVAVNADGVAHRPSIRGRGTVLHDNLNMAYNTAGEGGAVKEIATENLRILSPTDIVDGGKHTKVGVQLAERFADDMVKSADSWELREALNAVDDPNYARAANPTFLKRDAEATRRAATESLAGVDAKYQHQLEVLDNTVKDYEGRLAKKKVSAKDVAFYQEKIAAAKAEMESINGAKLVESASARKQIDATTKQLTDMPETKMPSANELRAAVKKKLDGKNLDEMIDIIDRLGSGGSVAYDPHHTVNGFIEDMNYNGYQFDVSKRDGSRAYRGIYVAEKFAKKLQKTGERSVPSPTPDQLAAYNASKEQKLKEYHDWVAQKAQPLMQSTGDAAGIPKQTVDETISAPKNEIQETLTASVEKKNALAAVDSELDRRIAETPEDADTYKALKKLSDDIKAGKDISTMAAEVRKTLDEYDVCMRGA
jgi:hypothetical protein